MEVARNFLVLLGSAEAKPLQQERERKSIKGKPDYGIFLVNNKIKKKY